LDGLICVCIFYSFLFIYFPALYSFFYEINKLEMYFIF